MQAVRRRPARTWGSRACRACRASGTCAKPSISAFDHERGDRRRAAGVLRAHVHDQHVGLGAVRDPHLGAVRDPSAVDALGGQRIEPRTSEPASASLIASAPTCSPDRSAGSHRAPLLGGAVRPEVVHAEVGVRARRTSRPRPRRGRSPPRSRGARAKPSPAPPSSTGTVGTEDAEGAEARPQPAGGRRRRGRSPRRGARSRVRRTPGRVRRSSSSEIASVRCLDAPCVHTYPRSRANWRARR